MEVISIKYFLIFLGILAVISLGIIGYATSFYNGLQAKTQAINTQWAQVETQYQRRFDLIPNLVNSVKGIMAQEQKVFGDIAQARTQYAGAKSVDDKVTAAGSLDGAISRLLVIVENYPQIKSDQAVRGLMDELSGTENRVSVERRRFNEVVQDYNTTIKMVPGSMFAGFFGFKERPYFQSASGADSAPQVNF